MFEVEQAMATWRRQMSEAGLAEQVLDELESHLCDDLERRTRSGENVQQAFEAALLTLGEANALAKSLVQPVGFIKRQSRPSSLWPAFQTSIMLII